MVSLQTVRILHVDDSSADAMLVRRLLAKSDLEVELHHCATRDAAVQHVKDHAVDLVLLDDYLGIVRGQEALEALVAAGYAGPTVMLSGVVPDGADGLLAHLGCRIWIDKNRLALATLEDAIQRASDPSATRTS